MARRNIVPLMLEGFDFMTPSNANQLTGQLSALKQYNALHLPADYFAEAMVRLRERYLNVHLEAVLHPASASARQAAEVQQAAAGAAPAVGQEELTAQEGFEKGFKSSDPVEMIRCYDESISLKPDFAEAYNNRGIARAAKGDLDGALRDYAEAIRLKPDYANAYCNHGAARAYKGNSASTKAAIADYQKYLDLGGGIRNGNQAEVKQFICELKNKL